jgi:hypothetical protein
MSPMRHFNAGSREYFQMTLVILLFFISCPNSCNSCTFFYRVGGIQKLKACIQTSRYIFCCCKQENLRNMLRSPDIFNLINNKTYLKEIIIILLGSYNSFKLLYMLTGDQTAVGVFQDSRL